MEGLRGRLWRRVVSDIESLISEGCYERVNNFMSLLQAGRLRRRAAAEACRGPGSALDLGAGSGKSTLEYCRLCTGRVVMLDVSASNLSLAAGSTEKACGGLTLAVMGRFESLPLKTCSMDSVFAMFSLRDAIDRRKAVEEAARVLRSNGRLVILDIYSPQSRLAKLAFKAYLAVLPPLAAVLLGCPHRVLEYSSLWRTLDSMDTIKGLAAVLKNFFEDVRVYKPMEGAALWVAERPLGGCSGDGG